MAIPQLRIIGRHLRVLARLDGDDALPVRDGAQDRLGERGFGLPYPAADQERASIAQLLAEPAWPVDVVPVQLEIRPHQVRQVPQAVFAFHHLRRELLVQERERLYQSQIILPCLSRFALKNRSAI